MLNEIERSLRFSALLSFACRLDRELMGCHGVSLKHEAILAEVRGVLSLAHDDVQTCHCANIFVEIRADWQTQPPLVYCTEDWVRNDPDWHSFKEGLLCYVLPEEWKDLVRDTAHHDGISKAGDFAVQLLVRNVRWLLYRQFIAHLTGISKWPKDWPAWAHNEAGRVQYLKTREAAA